MSGKHADTWRRRYKAASLQYLRTTVVPYCAAFHPSSTAQCIACAALDGTIRPVAQKRLCHSCYMFFYRRQAVLIDLISTPADDRGMMAAAG